MLKKHIILIIISIILLSGCVSSVESITPEDQINAQINRIFTSSYKKDEIIKKAKYCLANYSNSLPNIMKYSDKDLMVVKGWVKYPCNSLSMECLAKSDWQIWFTLNIFIKDYKFKVIAKDYQLGWPPSYDTFGFHKSEKIPIKIKSDLDKAKKTIESFIKYNLVQCINNNDDKF